MSFRKKVILSQVLLFLIFFAALFPLIEKMASVLVKDSLIESTRDLKERLSKTGTELELIQSLKKQEYYAFFRMSLLNDKGLVIYDTHLGKLRGEDFTPYFPDARKEIQEALETGIGYVIARSDTFKGRFAYVAETFDFQGKTYILRTAFPYQQIEDLTRNFKIGVLIFSFIALLFFNSLILFIFNKLTRPIQEIIHSIKSPILQKETTFAEITLSKKAAPSDDFQKLADALNHLSKQVRRQVEDLKAERNEKSAIVESLLEGVLVADKQLNILYVNSIACEMLGTKREEIFEHSFKLEGDRVNQDLLRKTQDLLLLCQQEEKTVTDSYVFGDEKKTYIDLIAIPKGKKTGAIVVLQDKTKDYRVLDMGKDFIANASHELRTPITIIKGYAETLQDYPDLGRKKYEEITEKINRNCIRMESLIRSLLILTDIENVLEDHFSETDLKTLIQNCRHAVCAVYPDADIKIEAPEEKILIKADSGLLELALINLLDNAAKYSDSSAQITIELTLKKEEVVIAILDKGKGIPKEDLKHIFDRFYRVDKTHSRKLGGAGLGLSIVKRILDKHKGKIEVESDFGKGSTFTITLTI